MVRFMILCHSQTFSALNSANNCCYCFKIKVCLGFNDFSPFLSTQCEMSAHEVQYFCRTHKFDIPPNVYFLSKNMHVRPNILGHILHFQLPWPSNVEVEGVRNLSWCCRKSLNHKGMFCKDLSIHFNFDSNELVKIMADFWIYFSSEFFLG